MSTNCRCFSIENKFLLGQFYFNTRHYIKASNIFEAIKKVFLPALYQLGVIIYDDLLDKVKKKRI
jgi:predicted metal-dependent hydrolase